MPLFNVLHHRSSMPEEDDAGYQLQEGMAAELLPSSDVENPYSLTSSNGGGGGGVKLAVEDMSYFVGKKCIMSSVSAAFYPGETCALMGPSGAGKTTLLNVLSRRAGGKVEGRVLLNDVEASATGFKAVANYVPQDDDMLVSLTPREQLDYVAELRMPREAPKGARRAHVDELIRLLRLDTCKDVAIGGGSTGKKGISGGQRKRVSIAMELVNEPSVLFLDEPTSGLDSAMAQEVIASVHALSRRGLNVVCTIHQPSKAVFESFDELCLLFYGRVVYHGSPEHAVDFFRAASIVGDVSPISNPADVLLGALVTRTAEDAPTLSEAWSKATRREVSGFFDSSRQKDDDSQQEASWHNENRAQNEQKFSNGHHHHHHKLATSASSRRAIRDLTEGFVDGASPSSAAEDPTLPKSVTYPISKFRQFLILFRRACYDHVASKLRIQLRVAGGLGLLYGLVFYKLENTQDQYDMRLSALFMSVIYNGMMCVSQASILVPLEKRVLLREYQNGAYAVFPYFAATIATRILFQAMASTVWAIPFYFMAGLRREGFAILLATVILLAYIALVFGFMIGTVSQSAQKAQQLLVPSIMPLIIFCGFLLQWDGVRSYFLPLWYASFFRYAFTILVVNEFDSGEFDACATSENHFCPLNSYGGTLTEDGIKVDRKYVVSKILKFRSDAIPLYYYVLLIYALGISAAGYYLIRRQARRRYG